ncbi:butyrophilin-like protein 10 [Oncorhynchus clarkii lewisi]|uniref:butyrophilin-like protein 10 n=1 Tax=Oncorhynchus clarkii lewisi TaxID=490388 RepID=UPI0039B84020
MKTFPTSAVWCFGILFISVSLITTGSSEVQVVGSVDRVDALAGDDVILPCSLKPNVSAKDMLVQWTGLNLKIRNVHLYRQGRDSNEEQFPSYRGRTSMFHEELKNGNVSLKLNRVTLSDAGSYRCFIPTLTSQVKETTVQLFVGAVSQPVISIVGTKDWGVVLKCESGGWFPEPEMEWLDSSGTILPADGPPERHRDSEDLYALRRHVTVDQTDTNRFTCRVHQMEINHLKETEIHVPDDVFPKSQVGLIVGLSILLAVVVLTASAGVYKWRKHTDGLQGELSSPLDQLGSPLDLLGSLVDLLGSLLDLIGSILDQEYIMFYLLSTEERSSEKTTGKLKRPSNPIQSPPLQEVNRKQTPSQKSEGIEGMKMESFPAPEMETLPEG